MRTACRHKLDTAGVVLQFQEQCPDPNPASAPAVAELGGVVRQAEDLLAQSQRHEEVARMALAERGGVETEIRGLLAQLIPLGRVVSRQEELPPLDLRKTDLWNTAALVPKAAAALEWGRGHAEPLLRYGMPDSLLDQLADAVHRHGTIVLTRSTSLEFVEGVPAAIDRLVEEAQAVIDHLDALNGIRFAADPPRLAEWKRARRVRWNEAVGDVRGSATPFQPTT